MGFGPTPAALRFLDACGPRVVCSVSASEGLSSEAVKRFPILSRVIGIRVFSGVTLSTEGAVDGSERGAYLRLVPM